jgi:spore germination protein GerM
VARHIDARYPERGRSRLARWVAMATIALVTTGCGISIDKAPRDVAPPAERVVNPAASPVVASGTTRVYFLRSSDSGATELVAVQRDVGDDPTAALTALLAGPTQNELDGQLRTALPQDVTLRSATLARGLLIVDVSRPLGALSGDGLVAALAQIVVTADELPAVNAVRIVIDGEAQQWPVGGGKLSAADLTQFDYIEFVASVQPDFPGVPSG